jgi:FlaA1/EpsC-like NDP-sugar epimerase
MKKDEKMINSFSYIATGRYESLFKHDIEENDGSLHSGIDGKRFLIIGGAGSIGSSTIRALLNYAVRAVHVVDISENNLVELIRDLRGSHLLRANVDFRALPIDYGSEVFHRFLLDQEPYDFIFNFAAVKHVRSEKDIYSVLQMIDTNIIKQARLLTRLQGFNNTGLRYFSVSTDKAANPVNLMGATKRIMEQVMFWAAHKIPGIIATSARFANVAFSDGSLLHGWVKRMEKKQPIPVPVKTQRYFISLEESGHICLLSGVLGQNCRLMIPRLSTVKLKELVPIAREFIISNGFNYREYNDEGHAVEHIENDMAGGFYPLLLTPLDTSGEKPFEEFVGEGEKAIEIGMKEILAIEEKVSPGNESIEGLISEMDRLVSSSEQRASKRGIIEAMARVIPQLRHVETGRCLDDRL